MSKVSLKISRTPVREALLILEKDKLVEFDDRLGFIVRRLRLEEIDEYFNIRELLEFYAATLRIVVRHKSQGFGKAQERYKASS